MECGIKDVAGRAPTTIIKNEALFIACKLAKAGYYGGNPQKILKAPIDVVMAILNYEVFESDLTAAWIDIRKQQEDK